MPDEAADVAGLERQRAGLYEELSQVGDFRRGSLNEVWRRCGKAGCACAQPGHPGHGPQYNLTRSVGGKTVARHLKPGPELEKIRREVAEYERFRALVGQVSEVSEAICEARPVRAAVQDPPAGLGGEKGGSPPSSPRSRRRPPPR
ncbi:MAG TPA: DUF6788 family protein [Streptosporangiaceae bacterium]|jgi:hypothetical protein|nr:DUF6788 family protein [Streptosporangiaceae bacterium]